MLFNKINLFTLIFTKHPLNHLYVKIYSCSSHEIHYRYCTVYYLTDIGSSVRCVKCVNAHTCTHTCRKGWGMHVYNQQVDNERQFSLKFWVAVPCVKVGEGYTGIPILLYSLNGRYDEYFIIFLIKCIHCLYVTTIVNKHRY